MPLHFQADKISSNKIDQKLEPKNISISAANKLMERTSWGMMARGHQKATRPVHCIALHLQMKDEFNIMLCVDMYCTAIFG